MNGQASIANANFWRAQVTVYIHYGDHRPVEGATVYAQWGGGATGSVVCTTRSAGNCTFAKNSIPRSTAPSVSLTVNNVVYPSYTYVPADNHDPGPSHRPSSF